MQNKINNKWQWLRLIFLFLDILFPLRMAIAAGGIATDGTVGPARTLNGAEVPIEQKLGTTVGKNLFHSFSEFNINRGQTVIFKEDIPNALDNVISRVTGGSPSDINGTLRSTPGGHANLYLVNPSGVMFGQNARIDVPGSFHASTADEVRFQDGAKFNASRPSGSTLTAAAPASFGFLVTSSTTNGLLKFDGAKLVVGEGKKLDMVGRGISIENLAGLSAPAGELRLVAVGTSSMDIPIDLPSEKAHGALTLTRSIIDTSGEGGGKVIIRGGDLHMDQNAIIGANTYGKKNGAEIDVQLSGDLKMSRGSAMSAFVAEPTPNFSEPASGNAKGITVSAKNIRIEEQASDNLNNQSGIITATASHGSGDAGDISLTASENISISGNSRLFSSTAGVTPFNERISNHGKAGNISLTARNLEVSFGATIHSGNFTESEGDAGNITVTIQDDIEMTGGSIISASTSGSGNAGDILMSARNLLIDGYRKTTMNGQTSHSPTSIVSTTDLGGTLDKKAGNAGNITLDIDRQLALTQGGQIVSNTFGAGDAGNVMVKKAGQLLIDGQSASLLKDSSGNSLSTGIFTGTGSASTGRGGELTVTVQHGISIKESGAISASSLGEGDAGNVTINADGLSLERKSYVSTEAKNGNGGDINIQGGPLIQLINSGLITSVYGGEQREKGGGNITLTADNLVMETGAIQANTTAPEASGGDITLNLKGRITSGGSLIEGGDKLVKWNPDEFGFNVIQAAAPNGISGHIQSTAPQLDLSGVLSNLGMPQFDTTAISQDYCSLGTGSSLIRQGKGGLPPRSRDSVMY